ncbi:MAG: alpha-glucan family phosphorylase, partial [Bacteroidales bacterium]|nr:alpha-glucan family phosphorylase [Bacteroidales bacterium]
NLHGEVTRKMFAGLWEGYFPEELHIGYVTNGVHYRTWTAKAWQELYLEKFGPDFLKDQSNSIYWSKIYEVPDKQIWDIRQAQRKKLISYLRHRMQNNSIRRHEPPKHVLEVISKLDDKILTIGFARRFATYKRSHLLFKDIDRLAAIVNNPDRPVQFLFAGKAHPRDKAGQDLIKYIIEISRRPEFVGRIAFIENYDMTVARQLVQGVDIWLNTPTRPLEASGTSGMKAAMNGAMNFSVLDGWWCEGYREGAGWSLPEEKIYEDQDFQDELDATTLYNILEQDIVTLYYERDEEGIPAGWVNHIKNTIAQVAPNFTTKRMIDDYSSKFYSILSSRCSDMRANNYHLAKEMAGWKKRIITHWDKIEILSIDYSDNINDDLQLGLKYQAAVSLDIGELEPNEVGVELVVIEEEADDKHEFVYKKEFSQTTRKGQHVYYKLKIIPTQPGVFKFGIRIFPKHPKLPNRQDFSFLRWC